MIQEPMKVMLDHGDCFVGVNSLLDGFTPLQHCCLGYVWSVEVLEWLLDRGADPNHRSSYGQTVLHIIVGSGFSVMSPEDYHETVILLLERRANPTAVDVDGKSVSYYAYHNRTWPGSMAGDIWDSALVRCGYDLWDFRRGYPRRPNHTEVYGERTSRASGWGTNISVPTTMLRMHSTSMRMRMRMRMRMGAGDTTRNRAFGARR